MFEEYLQDAFDFYTIGEESLAQADYRKAKRYFRAAVFYVASAMEAFVNYLGASFREAGSLSTHATAFLNDKELIFDPQKRDLIERTRYYSLEDKVKFIINTFMRDYDIGSSVSWSQFIQLKEFRDKLVHPRYDEDEEVQLTDYQRNTRDGIAGIIKLMNEISIGLFKKPLRKQLLDLIPE